MGNQYFQFKRFTVQQAGSAMKVCTDACIQGAFTAAYIREQLPGASPVLDIGAGTGLLSLMLAQSGNGTIDAVELDAAAAQQAAENFAASPWSERLRVFHTDIAHFNPAQRYPFIITNPPFFDNDLQGPHQRRTAVPFRSCCPAGDSTASGGWRKMKDLYCGNCWRYGKRPATAPSGASAYSALLRSRSAKSW